MLAILDEELDRLSDHYRLPVVLCDLQGRSRKQAAAELKIPEGTLSSRLATAKRKLADRLKRRGVTLTAISLSAAISESAWPECLMLIVRIANFYHAEIRPRCRSSQSGREVPFRRTAEERRCGDGANHDACGGQCARR